MAPRITFRAITVRRQVIQPAVVVAKMASFQHGYALSLIADLQVYPPTPGGSTYVRTDELRRGWYTIGPSFGANEITTSIANRAPYWQYVQGRRQQPYHRAHGWQTVDDLRETGMYRAGLQAIITRHIASRM